MDIKDEADKRIRTAFIYAIAEIEKEFGYLWGEEKEEGTTSPEEDKFYEKFMNLRKRILDKGNLQIRLFNKILEK